MPIATVNIPGVSGDIAVEQSFWKGFKFSVAGQQVKPHGFPRNRLTLPGAAGPIEAKVKGGVARAYPSLVIDGKDYPTGPPTPKAQQVLALLPLLLLLLVQGALGILVAFGALSVNMGIVRAERSNGAKLGLMAAVLVVAATIDILLATAILSARGA
ncbi:hypothetical protein [Terrabacter sp. 2YAF2]|uniref:hypothetical protein n=1 Tax=Terrabacter sp. 2YAF2 TaxID=3233026 RepID=UPI003F9C1F43